MGSAEKAEAENGMVVKDAYSDIQVRTSIEYDSVDSNLAVSSDCPEMLDKTVAAVSTMAGTTRTNRDKPLNMSGTKTHAVRGVSANAGSGSNTSPTCRSRPALVKKLSIQESFLSPTDHSPSKVSRDGVNEENIKEYLESGNDNNKYQTVVEPKNGYVSVHEIDVVSRESRAKNTDHDFELKDFELKDTRNDEVATSNDVLKVDTTDLDVLSFSNKLSKVHSIKVSKVDKKQEVEGIVKEEVKSLLDQKDEEIRSLKKMLLLKEEMIQIQTEILWRNLLSKSV